MSAQVRFPAGIDTELRRAITIVDSTDLVAELAQWRATDKERGVGGRPAAADDRAVMILLIVTLERKRPLLITEIAGYIQTLSPDAKAEIGLRDHLADGADWYDRIWRAWSRLHTVVDAFPLADRRHPLTVEEFQEEKAARDPVVQDVKRLRLEWLINELIEASNRTIPRHIRGRWAGNTCIDATFVKAFANQQRRRERGSIEPDAWWYRRDGDHRVTQGDLNSGRTIPKLAYGWEAHLVIATSNHPDEQNEFPITVTAMTFDRPGKRTAENTVTAYTQMFARQLPVGVATGDLNYWPAQKADKMQLPLRALGHRNVNDYRSDHLGVQANHAGGIQVEGHWYCPAMPKELIDATLDYRVNHTIDEEMWKARIARRAGFLLKPKENADADGRQPLACPAIGKSATVSCPLRNQSRRDPNAATRVQITRPPKPANQDKICTQTRVTFNHDHGAKMRQDIRFGTDEWSAWYGHNRSAIESYNGYIKDDNHELLAAAGRRRLRGRTAQTILTAFHVVAANLRRIDDFLDKHEHIAPPTPLSSRRAGKRRTRSLRDHHPMTEPSHPPGFRLTG